MTDTAHWDCWGLGTKKVNLSGLDSTPEAAMQLLLEKARRVRVPMENGGATFHECCAWKGAMARERFVVVAVSRRRKQFPVNSLRRNRGSTPPTSRTPQPR
jgi:hypothetical protein